MYATYLINASKIWLLLYCTHQFIDKRKEKNVSMYKTVHAER